MAVTHNLTEFATSKLGGQSGREKATVVMGGWRRDVEMRSSRHGIANTSLALAVGVWGFLSYRRLRVPCLCFQTL
jgi:hypothetical protein